MCRLTYRNCRVMLASGALLLVQLAFGQNTPGGSRREDSHQEIVSFRQACVGMIGRSKTVGSLH